MVGDWFVADSSVPRQGGYQQTAFTWHAVAARREMHQFDQHFKLFCREKGLPFKLTEQSLVNLRKDKLPDNILKNLKPIIGKIVNTEEGFLEVVQQKIGNDQIISYKELILKYAENCWAKCAVIGAIDQRIKGLEKNLKALQESFKDSPKVCQMCKKGHIAEHIE